MARSLDNDHFQAEGTRCSRALRQLLSAAQTTKLPNPESLSAKYRVAKAAGVRGTGPFCFNMLHAPGVNVFIGEGELPQSVADEMYAVWTGFIRGEEPPWPAYNNETRPTWHFDTKSMLLENADDDLIAVWQDLR